MDFLFNPDKYFKEVADRISYKIPLLIVTTSAILGSINGYVVAEPMAKSVAKMLMENGMGQEQIQMILAFTKASTILAPFVMAFIVWLIIATVLHVVSSLLGGKGEFSKTLKLSAFSYIPNIVLFPLNLYVSIETVKFLETYGFAALNNPEFKLTSTLLGIVIMVWQYVYWIFVVKNARKVEIKSAIVTASILLILFLIPNVYSLISITH